MGVECSYPRMLSGPRKWGQRLRRDQKCSYKDEGRDWKTGFERENRKSGIRKLAFLLTCLLTSVARFASRSPRKAC